jgi:hypothetical protein
MSNTRSSSRGGGGSGSSGGAVKERYPRRERQARHRFEAQAQSGTRTSKIGEESKFIAEWRQSSRSELWLQEGHEWVGRRMRKIFPGYGIIDSTIVGWMPAEEGEGEGESSPALWHVVHDDGDEEDLEAYEAEPGLAHYERHLAANLSTAHKWVYKRVMRVFDRHGAVRGTISGYQPAGEGGFDEAQWHCIHDDEDEEDLDAAEIKEALAFYEKVGTWVG